LTPKYDRRVAWICASFGHGAQQEKTWIEVVSAPPSAVRRADEEQVMKVAGSIALVTGANRGLGLAFARALLEMGAVTVYAAARKPEAVTLRGVVPLKLDVTNDEDVSAAVRAAGDIDLLVNNAGIARPGSFLAEGAVEAAREHFEVNFVGPLRMARAFAPVLARNGGGAIVNVLSVTSWMSGPLLATYGASKSAAWALTNGLRIELAGQGTSVVGLHAGFIDTDLTRDIDAPKSSPEAVARTTLEALERGEWEVLADEITRQVHLGLSADHPIYFQTIAAVRANAGLPAQ
jgi:NAD(P)-dependent dehydrogenase (short-subunit alcohol dehydrogenase family)